MRAGRHAPFRCAIFVHDRQIWLNGRCCKRCIPEHLLGNIALGRDRTSFREGHTLSGWRRVFLQPVDRLVHRVNGSRRVRCTATFDTCADGLRVLVHADAPFVDRQTVWLALVSHAGHRHPRIGVTPAQRRIFFTIVHVAEDFTFDTQMAQIAASEELGNVLIRGPVDGNTQIVAVFGFEVGLVLVVLEPIVPEPVQVGELLVRKLVELAVRRRRELGTDEVGDVQSGVGHVCALAGHPVCQVACLLVTPVGADQIGVVDIGVINVFAGLHLGL